MASNTDLHEFLQGVHLAVNCWVVWCELVWLGLACQNQTTLRSGCYHRQSSLADVSMYSSCSTDESDGCEMTSTGFFLIAVSMIANEVKSLFKYLGIIHEMPFCIFLPTLLLMVYPLVIL